MARSVIDCLRMRRGLLPGAGPADLGEAPRQRGSLLRREPGPARAASLGRAEARQGLRMRIFPAWSHLPASFSICMPACQVPQRPGQGAAQGDLDRALAQLGEGHHGQADG